MGTNGQGLRQKYVAKLKQSKISDALARKAKFRLYTAEETSALADLWPSNLGGFTIPYFDMDGKQTEHYRFRYLEEPGGWIAATDKKPRRYSQPKGTGVNIYWPPNVPWRKVQETAEMPVYITEGELKSLCGGVFALPVIGLGGVSMFGDRAHGHALHTDLKEFGFKNRPVYIVFDGDSATKPDVMAAQGALAMQLLNVGGVPYIVQLPNIDGLSKLDDFLTNPKGGLKRFEKLLDVAEETKESAALREMKGRVCFIAEADIMYEYTRDLTMPTQKFVTSFYANWTYEISVATPNGVSVKRKKTAQEYLDWKNRAEFDGFTFAPGGERIIDRRINRWRGWPYTPKKGDTKPFLLLLDNIFMNQPKEHRDWFLKWCAYPLQHPGAKLMQCVIVWGGQGSGKSMTGQAIRDLYGVHGATITDHQLESNFTGWQASKQFILGEEIASGQTDKRHVSEQMKYLITGDTLEINEKFGRPYHMPNVLNMMLVSNNSVPVRIDEDDRRYFVIHTEGPQLPQAQRDEYNRWRKSPDSMPALMHYLLNYNTTGFDRYSPAPITDDKKDLVVHSAPEHVGWLKQLRDDPASVLNTNGVQHKHDLMSGEDVHALFLRDHPFTRVTSSTLGGTMTQLKFTRPYRHPVRTARGGRRVFSVRNHEKYANMSPSDLGRTYDKQHNLDTKKFQKAGSDAE